MYFSSLKFSGTARVLSCLWTVLPQTVSSMLKLLLTVRPLTEPGTLLNNSFWAQYCLLPQGNIVVLCQQVYHYALCGNTLVSRSHTHIHTQCHYSCRRPYQSSFTGHRSLLWDNECPVSFSHYGFGPFAGEPGHINFQDGLDKRPWWKHLKRFIQV